MVQISANMTDKLAVQRIMETNPMAQSARNLRVPVHMMAIPRAMLGARRSVYLAGLRAYARDCPDSVAVLTDGTDAFLRCNASTIRERVLAVPSRRVLVSADEMFGFVRPQLQEWFDQKAEEHARTSHRTTKWRYVNVGGMAGRVRDVLQFVQAANATEGYNSRMSWYTPWHDQSAFGDTVHKLWPDDKLGVRLDYDSEVFFVASKQNILTKAGGGRAVLHSRIKETDPCFIHVTSTRVADHFWMFKDLNKTFGIHPDIWNKPPPVDAAEAALAEREAATTASLSESAKEAEQQAAQDVVMRSHNEKVAQGLIKA